MSTKTLFSRLNRPVEHSQFWGPGLVILCISLLFLWMSFSLRVGDNLLKFSLVGVSTGALLLFRTRLGTVLYFCGLFGIVVGHYDRGFDLSSVTSAFRLFMSLLLFIGFFAIGWEQVIYHCCRSRRS